MPTPMKEKRAFAAIIKILDGTVTRPVADRALRKTGLDRRALRGEPGYLPLALELQLVETAAREVGERHLGLIIGGRHDYSQLGAYADYVLAAPQLAAALARGWLALPFLQPGGKVTLRDTDEHFVVGYDSTLHTFNGARQFDEGMSLILRNLVRLFAGNNWSPAWVELPRRTAREKDGLETYFGAPVHSTDGVLGIAIPKADLLSQTPRSVGPTTALRLQDLPDLMGLRPPTKVGDRVASLLRTQLLLGDTSVETIAGRMSLGVRTLERLLHGEGTSFRTLKQRFLQERACDLIIKADLGIDEIARSLGYREPNSFRRAFRDWTGLSPSAFARAHKPTKVD
ncbi:MAG: AraC family transcriptional regulator ligand-binding domain-containing protein [Hyphomicrobiales bacterium]|nr:AraC family transcriptional regulator ligand-binding domain-containing protein [Hyphomicrobiales bacterium]